MHLMHWFELWVSQETAAHAAYMSWIAMWCLSPVRVSESAACCALVSVVTGWGGRGGGEASLVAKLILLSFQSLPRKSLKLSAGPSGARARYIKTYIACATRSVRYFAILGTTDTSHKNKCTFY